MYDILITTIIIIILIIYFLLVRKKINKVTITIGIIILCTLPIVLNSTNIERNITEFNTLEEAVNYQRRRKDYEEPVYIKSENSAIALFKYETYPSLYEKENEKWKISNLSGKDYTPKKIVDGYNIYKITSKSDNKIYIILMNSLEKNKIKEQDISDSRKTKFNMTELQQLYENIYNVTFYTILDNDIENYTLNINGKTIEL